MRLPGNRVSRLGDTRFALRIRYWSKNGIRIRSGCVGGREGWVCSACAKEAVHLSDPVRGKLAGAEHSGVSHGAGEGRTVRAEEEEKKRRKEDTKEVKKEGRLVLPVLKTFQEPHGEIQALPPRHEPHTAG